MPFTLKYRSQIYANVDKCYLLESFYTESLQSVLSCFELCFSGVGGNRTVLRIAEVMIHLKYCGHS